MRASGSPCSSTVATIIASASGTSWVASSYQARNCSIGSADSASRRNGGMSGRRGTGGASLAIRAFYNDRREGD